MKKILSTIFLMIIVISTLVSCGGAQAPEGMQLVEGSDELGYYFYGPEEWLISNIKNPNTNISVTYASKVDSSSASYAETVPPTLAGTEGLTVQGARQEAAKRYFHESMKSFPSPLSMLTDAEPVTFGNAEHAFSFIYDYEYTEHSYNAENTAVRKFREMQILVYFEDRFGIFTFVSMNEPLNDKSKTQYEFYSEKRQKILDNFKFVTKAESEAEEPEREADADGYLLSSDANVSGLNLYLPPEYKLLYSSGIITAELPDGSSLVVSNPTVSIEYEKYFDFRLTELEALFGEIKVNERDKERTFANGLKTHYYDYEFTFEGETYRVYQIVTRTTSKGYTFTYTAKAENYENNLEALEKIFAKVELK